MSLALAPGETLALLGPSGCGKSTLLRLIAGLELPDSGRIQLHGEDVTRRPPERRDLSLVFQDYALFPHLNVLRNVSYGPLARGLPRAEAERRAREALALVGLAELAGRRVTQLSGGQQQRVALARALAPHPRLLLLDEPLSNLDEQRRQELHGELGELFARLRTSVLLVTHDQREALSLADRLVLMRAGRVVQQGPAREVLAAPASAWAAAFLGHRNLLPRDGKVLLVPEDAVRLGRGDPAEVLEIRREGQSAQVRLAHRLGELVLSLSPRESQLLQGDRLALEVDEARCLLLPDDRAEPHREPRA